MTKKHKFSHAERIAARIAGRMVIVVRDSVGGSDVGTAYWRGLQVGVRTMVAALAGGHRIAANVRKIDRVTKLLASINAPKEQP